MLNKRHSSGTKAALVAMSIALLGGSLAGCSTERTFTHGFVIKNEDLALVPVGSSKEQVILTLGNPSTINNFDGKTYYYISQTKRRKMAFMRAKIVSQRVIAVYFNKDEEVSRIADYGLKDGKVFDFITRTTPTGGKELSFLTQLLSSASTIVNPFKSQ
jgi:outer membrane protein assembly factor BamE (lipoprotein component of BamABCDE complex)